MPGVLNDYYNTEGTNPINMCEACASGPPDRCQRNHEELYFGNSGAFRCLTERKWLSYHQEICSYLHTCRSKCPKHVFCMWQAKENELTSEYSDYFVICSVIVLNINQMLIIFFRRRWCCICQTHHGARKHRWAQQSRMVPQQAFWWLWTAV